MSASREKKKRQQMAANGSVSARTTKAAQQEASDRRTNMLYGLVAIAFVVLAIVLIVINSGVIQRNKTAVTIGGENYTAGEVSYYYGSAYQNIYSYASLYGLDTSQPLDEQECLLASEEGQTWDDYLKEQAVESMKYIHACTKAAKEENMTLGDAEMETFNSSIASIKSAAAEYGYSYGAYVAAMYGSTVTTGIYENCLKDQLLANKYADSYEESLSYTEDEITAYYEENKNTYDRVNGGYVTVNGTPETTTDEDGNTIEATDEEKEAAMGIAEQIANAILASYKDGEDLETIVEGYDEASVVVGEDLTYSSSTARDWLFDESRTSGDAEVLVDEDSSNCYVVVFNERYREETVDYNVRHILITEENLDLGEDEEATQEMLEAKAQEILDTWDGTEDGFASLAEEYSQDSGSNTNGGLYENVAKGDMITPFNDWCYEEGRAPGDTGIVYYSGTGAHIMYFVGYGEEQYWHHACESRLRQQDVSDWQTEIIDNTEAVVNESGMKSVGA